MVARSRTQQAVYLTTQQAAQRLGVGASTLRRYVASGDIEISNVGTPLRPRWRLTEAELDRFIASRRRPAHA